MKENKVTVIVKTGRFDNIDSAVIIRSVSKAFQFCTTLLTLLMMTAGSMLSKRPVLRITEALFFLLQLFSSHM